MTAKPFLLALGISVAMTPIAHAQAEPPLLNGLFQDHAVLQRDRPIAVWGSARPREQVEVAFDSRRVTARANAGGEWRVTLPALPAGGVHTLTATSASGRTQIARDLLIGDVWLCSGQSNMEFELTKTLNAAAEIGSANDPEMRLLSVRRDTSKTPVRDFLAPVRWDPVTPQSVPNFSAACYFMGRDLRKSAKVPIGLINASWGGTAIDLWRSATALQRDPSLKARFDGLARYRTDPASTAAAWGKTWQAWYGSHPGAGTPWASEAIGEWRPVPSFQPWETWGIDALGSFDGTIFYRTTVTLTAAQAKRGATLEIGAIDDRDVTMVNGTVVGSTTSWNQPRRYTIAPGALTVGENRITIAAYDSGGGGGLQAEPGSQAIRFADGTAVPLPEASRWQYWIAPAGLGDPPQAPWDSVADMFAIYNGMIAPLGAYGLRGVAWYQGEADAGTPVGYAGKLADMMLSWRTQFGDPALPFLIVQLADFGPRVSTPQESGFARIREEQRRAVQADRHAALAVTVDLGEPHDIHPANKLDVGHRLAQAAQVVAYGSSGSASGPWAISARRTADGVLVRFDGVTGTLAPLSADVAIGFELCGTARSSCRYASGRVVPEGVLLPAGSGPADRVRFCWADSPICNLYDASGRPAVPFELPVQ
jgi:sialate O-acetylesterase